MGASKCLVAEGSELYIILFPALKTFMSQATSPRFWFQYKSSYWEKLSELRHLEISEGCSLQGDGLQRNRIQLSLKQ